MLLRRKHGPRGSTDGKASGHPETEARCFPRARGGPRSRCRLGAGWAQSGVTEGAGTRWRASSTRPGIHWLWRAFCERRRPFISKLEFFVCQMQVTVVSNLKLTGKRSLRRFSLLSLF